MLNIAEKDETDGSSIKLDVLKRKERERQREREKERERETRDKHIDKERVKNKRLKKEQK